MSVIPLNGSGGSYITWCKSGEASGAHGGDLYSSRNMSLTGTKDEKVGFTAENVPFNGIHYDQYIFKAWFHL